MHKHAIKSLTLALMAALGLMAFMAAGAQAEVKMPILVLGKALHATIAGTALLGRLLIPALKLEIHCETGDVSGLILEDGVTHVTVLFKECLKIFKYNPTTLALEGSELTSCLIINGGEKHHITANALFDGLLHKGKVYGIALGSGAEEAFTTIEFSNECAIVKKAVVKGSYSFEVEPQTNSVTLLLIPGNKALQELLKTGLKFGANEGILDPGIVHVGLTGLHEKCTWGAA
jgi:hypothetical protein